MLELRVDGMTCQGCVRSVTNALKEIDAAADIKVDLSNQTISIETNQDAQTISATIEEAGYSVKEIKKF